jgi:putative hemolysin
MSYVGIFVLLALCVAAQGFFSGSEMAMVSADRLGLQAKAKAGHSGAALAVRLLEQEESLLGTCLIGTNLCLVTGTTLVSSILLMADFKAGFATAVVFVPVALIFGENLPKTVFQAHADRLAPIISHPLRWVQMLFSPALLIVQGWSKILEWVTGSGPVIRVTPEEIVQLLDAAPDANIDQEEKRFIKGVFAISETTISECMTPLAHVTGIRADASLTEARELLIKSGYSRLPVHRDRVDNIEGVLHIQDLLFAHKKALTIDELMLEVAYVPESKPVDDLLHEMRRDQLHMAVVVDEYGGSAGIVTIEDILEEVIGDIRDERDFDAPSILRIGPREWSVPAQTKLEDICDHIDITFKEGDYETLAGYILAVSGRIPHTGETVRASGATFFIEEATDRMVQIVRITLPWRA